MMVISILLSLGIVGAHIIPLPIYNTQVLEEAIPTTAVFEEISSKKLDTWTLPGRILLIEPEPEIVEESSWTEVSGIATAYAPYDNQSGMCAEGDPAETSIQMTSGPGVWAVDPNMIPYRSEIRLTYSDGTVIEGIAGDTGGALRTNGSRGIYHIDVFHWTYAETQVHGVQEVKIEFREEQ